MCLKGIPIQVKELNDFERINNWIIACCILHNMITLESFDNFEADIDDDDEGDDNDDDDEEGGNDDDETGNAFSGSGRAFRETLKNYVLNN